MNLIYNIDIDELEFLENSCFKGDVYSKNQLSDILSNTALYKVIAVEIDNKKVGYAIVLDNSESYEIMKIGTPKEHRKKGIGKILIDHISSYKKDIYLEVRETNLNAISFYAGNGFEIIGKRKHYYTDTNEAAIIMIRKIDK